MNEQLKNLYKTVILEHNARPFHFEKKESAGHVLEAYNPLCGDRFQIFFEIKNGVVSEACFHGYGCAISKASTSVLVKNLENQPVEKAQELCRAFLKMTDPASEEVIEMDEEFTAFAVARDFPGRLKCATLSWEAVASALAGEAKPASAG
jgi:nitrogen fixation protein NifU and related proteins